LFFGEGIQLVKGDEYLGRAGVEDVDEIAGRGNASRVDVDIE
jgi:hypothetical protein